MFKLIVLSVLVLIVVISAATFEDQRAATPCHQNCTLPSCRCSGVDIPGGLKREDTPQFVMLTFDDAVTISNYDYYVDALGGKKNPDGCPVAATYYVAHEYTDYTLLHKLHAAGHEIALHSITHTVDTKYWRNANLSLLTAEFEGARSLMSNFGKIPATDFKGIRLPFLQMSGDLSFEMLSKNKFLYDSSWPTQSFINPGLWPYTLEHRSTQDCVIGPCPENSWPGVWVLPMITWRDQNDVACSMVDMCVNIPETVDELVDFMMENFNRSYNSNRAPFGFYVHAAWFVVNPDYFEAYVKFIDRLQKLKDVFIVGASDVVTWIKNPIPVASMNSTAWNKCRLPQAPKCVSRTCKLMKGKEERYMTSCADACPEVYPWLYNPMGKA